MDTSKFDVQIRNLQVRMDAMRSQMEEICKEFFEATKEFAVAWFQSCIEKEVVSQPGVTKKSGKKGLRNLKTELQSTIAKVPHIVEKHVNQDKYWVHRGQLPDDNDLSSRFGRYQTYGRRAPEELEKGVRELLGYAGAILMKHGFVDTGECSVWEVQHGSERPRYKYGYDWSGKMNGVIQRYSGQYEELIKLDHEFKKIQQEKAEAEAKDLWNHA